MTESPPDRRSAPGTGLSPVLAGFFLVALGLFVPAPPPLEAQLGSSDRVTPQIRPRVFLDCQFRRNCDSDHFRTEIQFVNWVRDRTDADVHVIFTGTGAGGDGMQYTLDFVGRRDLAGMNDRLTYTSMGTDVRAEVIEGLTRSLRLGLLRYAVETGQGRNFEVSFTGQPASANADAGNGEGEGELRDPWNFWTFRFGLSGDLDLQERRSVRRLNPSLGADRVTEAWKVNVSLWANLRRERVELGDGREVRNDTDSWRVGALVVRSISEHMSVGLDTDARNSIVFNQRVRVSVRPAIEWNYYPYMQATRRQLIAHYSAGMEFSDYYEETIFGEEQEVLPQHRVAIQYRAREQWGNAGIGIETSQYLHDASLYSYGMNGDLSYRIARGLELNVAGGASRVNDQIHVAASEFSDEDVLLGRVSLPTGYQYEASIGFNYRWGSTMANIVNNRFPRSVR
jgi:hypothetical protein